MNEYMNAIETYLVNKNNMCYEYLPRVYEAQIALSEGLEDLRCKVTGIGLNLGPRPEMGFSSVASGMGGIQG